MAKKKYTPKAFALAVEKYFRSISYLRTATNDDGNAICNNDGETIKYYDFAIPPSVTELCLKLGITRDTFDAYMRDESYADICKSAKARIEVWLERQLNTREKSVDGIKFNLTYNYGWTDKKYEVELGSQTRSTLENAAIPMDERLEIIKKAFGEISDLQSGQRDGSSEKTSVDT